MGARIYTHITAFFSLLFFPLFFGGGIVCAGWGLFCPILILRAEGEEGGGVIVQVRASDGWCVTSSWNGPANRVSEYQELLLSGNTPNLNPFRKWQGDKEQDTVVKWVGVFEWLKNMVGPIWNRSVCIQIQTGQYPHRVYYSPFRLYFYSCTLNGSIPTGKSRSSCHFEANK